MLHQEQHINFQHLLYYFDCFGEAIKFDKVTKQESNLSQTEKRIYNSYFLT